MSNLGSRVTTSQHTACRQFCVWGCFILFLVTAGCASRITTEDIRTSLASGELQRLEKKMKENHETYGEMVTALNLARIYQLEGLWAESKDSFATALELLEEYENRAIVNLRGLAAKTGKALLSRGAESYFGTGFERSLLHTFNSLNYIMLGDFSGASVELRKMDQRQALWLEECQARIEEHLRSKPTLSDQSMLPANYSMRELLQDEAVRSLLNNYQEPFSYALGAILYRLSGDYQAAEVSMKRATALDPNAGLLFTHAWGNSDKKSAAIAIPRLQRQRGKDSVHTEQNEAEEQELTIIAFTGLAPALGVENIRVWFPAIGYILVDLPTYKNAVTGTIPTANDGNLTPLAFFPLLHTDTLAYRTLSDELGQEMALATSRALSRAGISVAAYAAARSNKDTQQYAPLVGHLTTALLDLFASKLADSVRNWETLPKTGYIAMTKVPRGSTINLSAGNNKHSVSLPDEARGVIIMGNELSKTNLRVDYVTY